MSTVSVLNTDAGLSGKTLLNAEDAQNVTGLKAFNRAPNPPFTVQAGSAVVANLDADKLDGVDGSSYALAAALNGSNITSGTVPTARLPKFEAPLSVSTAAVANSGVGETDLITYALGPSQLAATGDRVRIKAWGIAAANANSKTFRLYFGTTVVVTKTETAAGSVHWYIDAEVIRTGAATQISIGGYNSVNTGSQVLTAAPGETLSSPINIKITGQSAVGSNDITSRGMIVEFIPAP